VDDAGMSFDSNNGAEMALIKGVSTSVSVMNAMPLGAGICTIFKDAPGNRPPVCI